jgi:hypothetical protein
MILRTLSSIRNRLLTCVAGVVILAAPGTAGPAPSGLPQNAALVYYQACLFRSQVLKEPASFWPVSTSFDPEFDPNSVIRSFVRSKDYQFLIQLTTAASKMPQCDWGLVRVVRLNVPLVLGQVRVLAHYLVVQAKVFACDGQYKAALENALTLRRISRHFSDENEYTVGNSRGMDARAFDLIGYVLGKMPPDAETLTWLEKELAAGGEVEWRPRETLMKWLDWEVQCLQATPELLAKVLEDPVLKTKTEGLTAPQVLERARSAWDEVFKSALAIMESEKSPDEKQRELEELSAEAGIKVSERDPMTLMPNLQTVDSMYTGYVNGLARVHATQAAIAIYHVKATTGQLPQTLPGGLPKDPYSGKDFEYQRTEKGFVLRCRAGLTRHGQSAGTKQLEFQVVAGKITGTGNDGDGHLLKLDTGATQYKGGLTREAQHGVTFASPSVAYLLVCLWGRCPQAPGIFRFGPETG